MEQERLNQLEALIDQQLHEAGLWDLPQNELDAMAKMLADKVIAAGPGALTDEVMAPVYQDHPDGCPDCGYLRLREGINDVGCICPPPRPYSGWGRPW